MNLSDQEIALFNYTLKNHTRFDLSDYSEKSLKRRLAKILIDYNIDLPTIIKNIKKDSQFVEQVVKDITVNTTELFRDPVIWQALRFRVLPKYEQQKQINIWHAGCSTGQEVYSMMILLNEMNMLDQAKIFASDINDEVIKKARAGVYKYKFNIGYLDNFDKVIKENPYNFEEYNDVAYEKYFTIDKDQDEIRMNDFLRKKPVYKVHDLVKDPNLFYVRFDIIICRNVIIYFNHKLQNHVFNFFNETLFENGHLILGKQETLRGGFSANFEKHGHVYIKKSKPAI